MKHKKTGLSVGFLFDDTLDSNDAVAQYVKLLGSWLTGAGHSVCYLVGETKMSSWAGGPVYSLSQNVKVTFNGNRLSMPVRSDKSKIKRVLAAQQLDVLHVMVPYSPFMAQRVISLAPSNTAVVGTFHIFPLGVLSRIGTRLLRPIYGHSLKRFGSMVSVSQPAADFCRQSLGVSSSVVPNPVDVSKYKVAAPPASRQKRIVFLGRLVQRKGCEELLRAFAVLSADMPEVRLMIAGDGPKRQNLEQLAARLNIEDKTTFLGHIPESAKPALLASADIACFPALYGESFGLVLIEAMAAGTKTILGGDNPGYRSVLSEQPACLIDPRDSLEFASRLQRLLTDRSLRRRLQQWQRQAVVQYDIETVGPRIEAVYRDSIARLIKNGNNSNHG